MLSIASLIKLIISSEPLPYKVAPNISLLSLLITTLKRPRPSLLILCFGIVLINKVFST